MRRHPLSKWVVVCASAVVLCWGFAPGCRVNPETGQTEVHWPTVGVELGLVAGDLHDAASIADPDIAETLDDLASLVGQVGFALRDGPPDLDTLALIDNLLLHADNIWEAVSGFETPSDVRVAVLVLRSTLRRVRQYAMPLPP
jgi:hypothetical protein